MFRKGPLHREPIPKVGLSPCMVEILSALGESEMRYNGLKSKLVNPETKKPYTDRALSLNLQSLEKRGLIERLAGVGHRPYRITVKGIEEVQKIEDYWFIQQNSYYKTFDIETFAPIPPPLRSSVTFYGEEYIGGPNSSGRLENLDAPEKIVSDYHPIFPLSTSARIRLSENGRLALEPWLQKMRGRYGMIGDDETEEEWLHKEVVDTLADPIIRKLCEIVFERTRVLAAAYSDKDMSDRITWIPTFQNIMNFNFEFALRYSGEDWLKSASKESVKNAQHLLAGMILLYLSGEGGGPLMSFSWDLQDVEALVKTEILTKEEVDPILKTCVELVDAHTPPRMWLQGASALSEFDKRRLTMSAYRRFYQGGLFGDCTTLSWEERLELLPFMKAFQEYMNFRARRDLAESLGARAQGSHLFMKERAINECSRVLLQPEVEVENHFARLTKIGVFIAIDEELRIYRWNTDMSFRLFG